MSDWTLTAEQRVTLYASRDARGIDADLISALEYNPEDTNRNEDAIKRVLATHQGERDEERYIWLVEFNDGIRGLYVGWCDYTGWDCQSGLTLLPFEGWEEEVRGHFGPTYRDSAGKADAVVAEIKAQLEAATRE